MCRYPCQVVLQRAYVCVYTLTHICTQEERESTQQSTKDTNPYEVQQGRLRCSSELPPTYSHVASSSSSCICILGPISTYLQALIIFLLSLSVCLSVCVWLCLCVILVVLRNKRSMM